MKDLSIFVEKFKKLLGSYGNEKEIMVQVLKQSLGMDFDKSDILIKNNVAYVSGSPALKNHLVIKKNLILEEIKKHQVLKITDVR